MVHRRQAADAVRTHYSGSLRGEIGLADTIERAALGETLQVAREAVLVVMCPMGKFSEPHWKPHRDRLRGKAIKLVELASPGPMNLGALL